MYPFSLLVLNPDMDISIGGRNLRLHFREIRANPAVACVLRPSLATAESSFALRSSKGIQRTLSVSLVKLLI